jgi:hypothetical protein
MEEIKNDIFDAIIAIINKARKNINLNEIITALPDELFEGISSKSINIVSELAECTEGDRTSDDFKSGIETSLNLLIDDADNIDGKSILSKSLTHVDIKIAIDSDTQACTATAYLYNKYVELDTLGPIIDGDIVIQGTTLSSLYGPSIVKVDFASDDVEDFVEVSSIMPWTMMFTPSTEEGAGNTFAIPVSVGAEHQDGQIRVRLYVDLVANIPFDDEKENYAITDEMIVTLDFQKRSSSLSSNTNNNNVEEVAVNNHVLPSSVEAGNVIVSIRVATDYDEMSNLKAEGYTINCTLIDEDSQIQDEAEHVWKFHVMTLMGLLSEAGNGVEDITWIRHLKTDCARPTLEEGYEIISKDLSDEANENSVFIATKIGVNASFTRLTMASTSSHELSTSLDTYVEKGLFKSAPIEIVEKLNAPCGLYIEQGNNTINDFQFEENGNEEKAKSIPSPTGSRASHHSNNNRMEVVSNGAKDADDDVPEQLSQMTFEDRGSDSDEDDYEDDEETDLLKLIETLTEERNLKVQMNTDLQKKAVLLLLREKSIQGPSKIAEPAPVEVDTGVDQVVEKDKQFSDTLLLISEGRFKLERQQAEFDQLALDLQTRLDDKEFKAGEIGVSFKEFKREILSKSVNSRTGKSISKRLMKQFEMAEQKREEDLEKVRLRNITLRMSLRKLEKTLRAREQLAEGLHMIDFEQLKIENQTLNEKIEERNEELLKMKRKKTVTVQVLTHIREKLRFTVSSNTLLHNELAVKEDLLTDKRGGLTDKKKFRDTVRIDNKELKRKQGFATSDLLLVDYEKKKTEVEGLSAQKTELVERYKILENQVKESDHKIKTLTSSRQGSRAYNLSEIY